MKNINIDDFIKLKYLPNKYIIYMSKIDDCKSNIILKDIIDYIFIKYETNNILKFIKELSYKLICINLPINLILNEILNKIIDDVSIIINKKYDCIHLIATFEYKYNLSYYKMIHFEYLLLKLYDIIKT